MTCYKLARQSFLSLVQEMCGKVMALTVSFCQKDVSNNVSAPGEQLGEGPQGAQGGEERVERDRPGGLPEISQGTHL